MKSNYYDGMNIIGSNHVIYYTTWLNVVTISSFLHTNVDLVFWKIENKNPTKTKILLGPTVLKNENKKHFENSRTK